jgi:hypothetical protein
VGAVTEHDAGQEQRDLEYIRAMLAIAGEDVRQVYLRVTAAIGLVVLFVTQLPFKRLVDLGRVDKVLLLAGIAAGVSAAALFFFYLSQMHKARIEIAGYLRGANADRVYKLWHGSGEFWDQNRWLYNGGNVLLAICTVLLGVVLIAMLHV